MYTILDTETASLQSGVVELALLHIDSDLNVIGEFHTRVNPERPIEPGAFAVHGISDADVADAPTLAQIPELGLVTMAVAHNYPFDSRMLKGHLNAEASLCTLSLSRQYLKGTTNHKLETLKKELGFQDQKSHSALGDVYTTLDLLRHLLPMTGVPLETLFKRAAQPKLIHRMTFGKHKGVLISQIPPEYRAWLLGQENLDKDLKYTLEKLK
jgi:exodeoxyribonuclease X